MLDDANKTSLRLIRISERRDSGRGEKRGDSGRGTGWIIKCVMYLY